MKIESKQKMDRIERARQKRAREREVELETNGEN